MKYVFALCLLTWSSTLTAGELGSGTVLGLGLYGGTANQPTNKPDQDSLSTGMGELSVGWYSNETTSWHLALQSVSMESSLDPEENTTYEGFRIGGRIIKNLWRFSLIAGIGAGSMQSEAPSKHGSMSHISPELGLGFALYNGESVRWDLLAMNHVYLSSGIGDIPRDAWVQHLGLTVTMSTSGPYRSRGHVHVHPSAVRGVGYMMRAGGKGGAAMVRGLFSIMRAIR